MIRYHSLFDDGLKAEAKRVTVSERELSGMARAKDTRRPNRADGYLLKAWC